MTDDVNEGEEPTIDTTTDGARSMTASRVIEASPERVYESFLDPDELAQWLPPIGFSAEVHELEPEEGGTFRITFTGETEEFADYGHSFGGTYLELSPGERIVYTDEFEIDDPNMAGEMTNTITFEAVDEDVDYRDEIITATEEAALLNRTESLADVGNIAAFVASDQARTMTATEVNISCGAIME